MPSGVAVEEAGTLHTVGANAGVDDEGSSAKTIVMPKRTVTNRQRPSAFLSIFPDHLSCFAPCVGNSRFCGIDASSNIILEME